MVEEGSIDSHIQNPIQALLKNSTPRLEILGVVMCSNGFPGVPKLTKKTNDQQVCIYLYVVYIIHIQSLHGTCTVQLASSADIAAMKASATHGGLAE